MTQVLERDGRPWWGRVLVGCADIARFVAEAVTEHWLFEWEVLTNEREA